MGKVDQNIDVFQPFLRLDKLPKAEHAHARQINALLSNLDYHIRAFGAAVSLYEYATSESSRLRWEEIKTPLEPRPRQSDVFNSWRYIAGRDGALTLYHFYCTIGGIDYSLGRCPTIDALVDKALLDKGKRTFNRHFPNATDLRHGVAHLGDNAANMKRFAYNAFSGSYTGPKPNGIRFQDKKSVMIVDAFQGDAFTTTSSKKIVTYRLNPRSLERLRIAGRRIWDAFERPTVRLM